MTRPLLGCIADDFTGATDLANNLVRGGMRTVQWIGVPDGPVDTGGAQALVVALKTRTVAPDEAVRQSLQALAWLQAQGVEQVYFKVCSTFDSTPQGNIGPVADALMTTLGAELSPVCPAFPETGRTVYQGHLFVGPQLLSDSGMRHHPLTPMTDASLVRLMQAQTRGRVGLVPLAVIARGAGAIRERLDALRAEGVRHAVLDAVQDADLQHIGAALAGMPLVVAGSGVAVGLPQNWRARGLLDSEGAADRLPAVSGACAVVSGSCSEATRSQVARAQAQGWPSFMIDPLALARGDDVVAQALDWAVGRVGSTPVLVYATAEPATVKAVQAALGVALPGELVEQALAAIARGLVGLGVRRLVVAGGETSGAVVQGLAVRQMQIGPQIDPGVPWTSVRAASCPDADLHVALKSGNFGGVDFFAKAFAVGSAA